MIVKKFLKMSEEEQFGVLLAMLDGDGVVEAHCPHEGEVAVTISRENVAAWLEQRADLPGARANMRVGSYFEWPHERPCSIVFRHADGDGDIISVARWTGMYADRPKM